MTDAELDKLKLELQDLLKKIKESQKLAADKSLQEVCGLKEPVPRIRLRSKRFLKGHISKVSCVHFSADNRHLVSGALDGKLIIWDTWTGNKMRIIPLRSSWVMTVSYSKSGNFVACGGMDNMCTLYDLHSKDSDGGAKVKREMVGLEGFLSCCCFLSDSQLITGSADDKIIQWDLETGEKIHEFVGHQGDVMSMSLCPDGNTFVTGSVDKSAKMWDIRDGKCKQTFWGHESDVNSVYFHGSGFYFGTGSDDKTARLFDIRADQQLACFRPPNPSSGFTSCVLSPSGRLILCGSDDFSIHIWDTLKERHNGTLQGHENRITTIDIPDNGIVLASGSWDNAVRIWN